MPNTVVVNNPQEFDALRANDSRVLIAYSAVMQRLVAEVRKAAVTRAAVLIVGPTGSGKEPIARLVHENSTFSSGPFVAVNAGAIPKDLLEGQLFGHERGAFTGADRAYKGLVAQAHGGTLFLDELGDMPLEMQVKLLRVLQDKMVTPLGGSRPFEVEFRLITATNCDLQRARRRGTFRDDLYYRVSVFPVRTPALRNRVEDIEPLVRLTLRAQTNLHDVDSDALELLESYNWPGNIRELQNIVERAAVFCDGPVLNLDAVKIALERELELMGAAESDPNVDVLDAVIHEATQPGHNLPDTLQRIGDLATVRAAEQFGSKTRAAQVLGISRGNLHIRRRRLADNAEMSH